MRFRPLFSAANSNAFFATSLAHMVMVTPVPYGNATLNTSPLDGSGSDFPCKQRPGVYNLNYMNEMAVGAPQSLSFRGTAVHGGGSCQISVSLDEEPTKSSTWKVIKSIIGGCPANAPGNLAPGQEADVFAFTLPEGFPNGKATLAWSWLNHFGNREFYMNCAPIVVSGGADNHDVYSALPDMFVANIPTTACLVSEGQNFVYPNPGNVAEVRSNSFTTTEMTGPECQKPMSGEQRIADLPLDSTVSDHNIDILQPSSSVEAVSTSQAAFTPVQHYEIAATPAPATTTQAVPLVADGSCRPGSIPCPVPGSIVCVGSSQFGLCNIDFCAIPQDLAAGTTCSNNVISKRGQRHLHRHLGSHGWSN